MRIFTVWEDALNDTEMPWMVAAVDEYTVESHDGYPAEYKSALNAKGPGRRRELVIEISEVAVLKLFRPAVVKGHTE
jgi:hypothetical protein